MQVTDVWAAFPNGVRRSLANTYANGRGEGLCEHIRGPGRLLRVQSASTTGGYTNTLTVPDKT